MKNSGALIVSAPIVAREEQAHATSSVCSAFVCPATRPYRRHAHAALAADLQQLLALGGIDTAVASAPVGILPGERRGDGAARPSRGREQAQGHRHDGALDVAAVRWPAGVAERK